MVFSCSVVSDSVTQWTVAHQASLSITNSQSLPKLVSIESVMPSNHLILCCPLLLLPSIFASIRVFSNEAALHTEVMWCKLSSFRPSPLPTPPLLESEFESFCAGTGPWAPWSLAQAWPCTGRPLGPCDGAG